MTKELKMISESDCQTVQFVVKEIKMFDTRILIQFDNVPVEIKELKYKYDMSECIELEKREIMGLLNDFVKRSK